MALPVITFNPHLSGAISVEFNYSSAVVSLVRDIPGATFDRASKAWLVPLERLPDLRAKLSGFALKVHPWLPGEQPTPDVFGEVKIDTELAAKIAERYQFKTAPYGHQKDGMALGIAKRRLALFYEQGTGKTKTTIDILSYLKIEGKVSGALIIAPKCMLYTWEREIDTHSPLEPESRKAVVITGTAAKKAKALESAWGVASFYITNYATLLSDYGFDRLVKTMKLAIVLDESSAIKNSNAKTTRAIDRIGRFAEYKYILNGTPVEQGPLDVYAQFHFLDPNILGHQSFASFRGEYAVMGGFNGKNVVGYKSLDKLRNKLQPHTMRVLKKDCLDLPDKIYSVIEVDPGPKQLAAYKQMKEESAAEVAGAPNKVVAAMAVMTRMVRLAQISSGFLPTSDEFGEAGPILEFEPVKLDAVEELTIEAVAAGEKVIIWCRFNWELKQALTRLTPLGAVGYLGEMSAEERQSNVDKFQTDPTCKVFVGQLAAASVGITLTAASVEIYISNSFRLGQRLQSEDRAHRIGQKSNVTIYDICVRGTLDGYVLKALRSKKDLADVITGDNFNEVLHEFA